MNPPRGGRRFHLLRRGLALFSCLGPVSHIVATGLGSRTPLPTHTHTGGPLPKDWPILPPLPVLASEWCPKPDFRLPRDRTVGIVGGGCFTDAIVTLLGERGIPVGFYVDDRAGLDADRFGVGPALARRGVPQLLTEEFLQRSREFPGELLLIAGRIDCDLPLALADDPFHQISQWLARVVPEQPPPLHPVAFVAQTEPLPCPDRFAVLGFPGTGNVLTQNLVEALFARRPAEVPADWRMLANFSEQYFYGLWARVQVALAPLVPDRVEYIPFDFGTMRVTVECGSRAGVVFDVPSHRHLGLPTCPSHARPNREALDYFAAAGMPCVAVVRHPLEALLSCANKIERPARAVLDSPYYLDRVAADLADWTAHLLANRQRLHVVRYEDLASRRIDVLRELAVFVGQPLAEPEAEELFERFLNRNLTNATTKHFYRGGSDKWRAELEPRDLRRVLAHLPTEAFTEFGYDVPTEADLLPPVPFRGTPMPRSELHACLLEDAPIHAVPGPHQMRVVGSDAAMVEGLLKVFQEPSLLEYLAAGGLTQPATGQEPITINPTRRLRPPLG